MKKRSITIKLVQLRKRRNVCTGCGDEPGTHLDPCPNDADENRAEWEASVGKKRQRGPSARSAVFRLMAVW